MKVKGQRERVSSDCVDVMNDPFGLAQGRIVGGGSVSETVSRKIVDAQVEMCSVLLVLCVICATNVTIAEVAKRRAVIISVSDG